MKRKPKLLFILILFVSFIFFGYWWGCNREEKAPGPPQMVDSVLEGRIFAQNTAPDFTVKDLEGKEITSDSLKGKVVLLHFWATWCHYCRKEIPHLNDIYKRYGKQGVAILAVSLDWNGASAVLKLQKKIKMDYPVAIGDRKMQADFGNIRGLPTTFIITPQWQIHRVHNGYVPKVVLENSIQQLLKKKS